MPTDDWQKLNRTIKNLTNVQKLLKTRKAISQLGDPLEDPTRSN